MDEWPESIRRCLPVSASKTWIATGDLFDGQRSPAETELGHFLRLMGHCDPAAIRAERQARNPFSIFGDCAEKPARMNVPDFDVSVSAPEASRLPSPLNASFRVPTLWPPSVWVMRLVATSTSVTVRTDPSKNITVLDCP